MKILKNVKNLRNVKGLNLTKYFKIGALLVLVIILGFSAYQYAQKDITITVDGKIIPVETFSFTVGSVLDKEGIQIKENDLVEPKANKFLTEGININIIRAVPVALTVDNKSIKVNMVEPTVEKVLLKSKINLNKFDRVETNLHERTADSNYIRVIRVEKKKETRRVECKYNLKLVPNEKMLKGERKTIQKGEEGLKVEEVLATYENGEKVSEEVLSSKVVVEPIEEVVFFGKKERWEPADRYKESSLNLDYKKVLNVEATAYTHTGNTTYTGIWPYEGIVAVDPSVIPLKSKLFVEGYGFAEAQDTGGLIKGNIIDVFMDNREKALNWGRKQIKVYILETPEN